MNASEKQGLIKLALGGGLAALGFVIGEPTGLLATVAKNLAEGIGGDFISGLADQSFGVFAEGWFGEPGGLNHDLERVLAQALGLAAADVKQNLRRQPTYHYWKRRRPNDAEALRLDLEWLEQNAEAAIAEWLTEETRRAEITALMEGQPEEFESALRERMRQELVGYEFSFASQLQRQLAHRWQAHFLELLKTDQPARVACERLWRAALQQGMERLAQQVESSSQAVQQELEALKQELASAPPSDEPPHQQLFHKALRDWLDEDWAQILQTLRDEMKEIQAQGELLLDEVEESNERLGEIEAQGEVLLDEVGELKQGLARIEQHLLAYSEDGELLPAEPAAQPSRPLEAFDVESFVAGLHAPGGAVRLGEEFYVRRKVDQRLERQIVKLGSTTTIQAPRQTGKTSLLARGVSYAREKDIEVVLLDLQFVNQQALQSLDLFLRYLAERIVNTLALDAQTLSSYWHPTPAEPSPSLSPSLEAPQNKLSDFLEDLVLPNTRFVLAIDKVDRLVRQSFHTDFFALLRAWHDLRVYNQLWDNLNLVLVISSEPSALIANRHQSPFNVTNPLRLEDFNREQVADLNQRYRHPLSEREIPLLMALSHGHPYLTRQAFYTLVTEEWSWQDLIRVAVDDEGPFAPHLQYYYSLLDREKRLKVGLKQVIHRQRCPDQNIFYRLLQMGLVRGSSKNCVCRCELYHHYFKERL